MNTRELVTLGGWQPANSITIDLGPYHPTSTGFATLDFTYSSTTVKSVRISPGYGHRGDEKLLEARNYRSLIMLASRHQWLSPADAEFGAALAIEQLMGLVAPRRATAIRMLVAELSRIASHLAFLTYPCFATNDTATGEAINRAREQQRNLLLRLTGNRVHPMLVRIGGVASAPDDAWLADIRDFARTTDELAKRLMILLDGPFATLARGLAPVTTDDLDDFGLSGPVAAAAGSNRDVRLTDPYASYADYAPVITDLPCVSNDALGRLLLLAHGIQISNRLINSLADQLAGDDSAIACELSKVLKVPQGESVVSTEAPWGEATWYLTSRGDRTPWRMRRRTPGFANLQALERLLVDVETESVPAVIASLGFTIGEVDK